MFFLIQMGCQDVQEWNEQVKYQEAANKTIGY